MRQTYFHGTKTMSNRESILQKGFLPSIDGRFGEGIYLATQMDLALEYGPYLMACEIETSYLFKVHYLTIPTLLGETLPSDPIELEYLLEEAEGYPTFKEWVLANGYQGCEIEYGLNDSEVVIYDERAIESILAIEPHGTTWFPVKQFDLDEEPLVHIGTLNPADKGQCSYEGHGLSISTCPEEWQRIAKLGGLPWHTLEKESHLFLDFHQLNTRQTQHIEVWGLHEGFLTYQTAYQAIHFDEEGNEWYSLYSTYEEALVEMDDENDQPIELTIVVPTPQLEERLGMKVPLNLTFDLLAPLFVEEVLGWDGVYWEDDYDVLSAPRAVIVPTQLPSWKVV